MRSSTACDDQIASEQAPAIIHINTRRPVDYGALDQELPRSGDPLVSLALFIAGLITGAALAAVLL